jgi:beta-lactamase regulating signal transducer with metallopeptidase domain
VPGLDWRRVLAGSLGLVWGAGTLVLLARLSLGYLLLARVRRRARPADGETRARCQDLAQALGVAAPAVLVSDRVSGPCLIGLQRPTILLPPSDSGDLATSREVLAHELAHLVRRDCPWNLLGGAGAALLFFQPLVWLLVSRLARSAEDACDDHVLLLGPRCELDRSRYARALVDLAERHQTQWQSAAALGVVSMRSSLARRVGRILDTTCTPSVRTGRACAIAIAVLAGCGTAASGLIGARGGTTGQDASPGGAQRAQDAEVDRGLRWLAARQDKDGAFVTEHESDKRSRVGLTGLSLLTFLAADSTPTKGPHAKAVAGAVGWLRGQIDKDGLIGTMKGRSFAYEHAIATLALALTVQAAPDEELRKDVARATAWIEKARNPYKVWRYYPRDGDNDTSVTGWMVAALVAARDAGVTVDKDALKYAAAWYDEVTNPNTGQCGYTKRGEGSSRSVGSVQKFPAAKTEALTASALLARLNLGQKADTHPIIRRHLDTILARIPKAEDPQTFDLYYFLFASLAIARLDETAHKTWRQALEPVLLAAMRPEGEDVAPWSEVDPWHEEGGPIYATSLATLTLLTIRGQNRWPTR